MSREYAAYFLAVLFLRNAGAVIPSRQELYGLDKTYPRKSQDGHIALDVIGGLILLAFLAGFSIAWMVATG